MQDITISGCALDLQQRLLSKPTRRFLFIGHGDAALDGERTLGFTSKTGSLKTVSPETLASLLGAHSTKSGGRLDFVFLNGCETLELGRAVGHAGVPTVVCLETKVKDDAAQIFSTAFFLSVAKCRTYPEAFEDAKQAVLLTTRPGKLANGIPAEVPKYVLTDPKAAQPPLMASMMQGVGGPWQTGDPGRALGDARAGGITREQHAANFFWHAASGNVRKVGAVPMPYNARATLRWHQPGTAEVEYWFAPPFAADDPYRTDDPTDPNYARLSPGQRYVVMHVHFAGAWGDPSVQVDRDRVSFIRCEQEIDPATRQPGGMVGTYYTHESNPALQTVFGLA